MNINLPDETVAELRAMLKRQGDESDVETYVQRTLSKRLLFETITEARVQTAEHDPAEVSRSINEALRAARAARGE